MEKYSIFSPDPGMFSIQIPASWVQYEDREGTYVFFDGNEWAGNFRITPLYFEDEDQKSDIYLENVFQKNRAKEPLKIQIKEMPCITFKDSLIYEEGEELVIYYWFLQMKKNVFIFSFSIDKSMDLTPKCDLQLQKVVQVIQTVKMNY